MTGFNSKRDAAADKVQEPSATRPCRSCNGTGDRDTGIPEFPIVTCWPCNGTGQIALAQPTQEPVAREWLQKIAYDHGGIGDLADFESEYGAMVAAATRARCIELVLAGTAMPVQTRTLEALQRDRKRIAKLIEEDGK